MDPITLSTITSSISGLFNSIFGYLGLVKKTEAEQTILGRDAVLSTAQSKQTTATILIIVVAIAVIVFLIYSEKHK